VKKKAIFVRKSYCNLEDIIFKTEERKIRAARIKIILKYMMLF